MSWFNTRAPAQGTGFSPSQSTPTQRGTTPTENWYSGVVNQTAYSTGTITFDNVFAYPVLIGRSGYIDRIAFEVTTGGGAGSVARAAIYTNTSKYHIYPKDLVIDGGEKDTSGTGVMSTTVSQFLQAGLYWFCLRAGVASPAVRSAALAGAAPFFGVPSTIGANGHGLITKASTYAAWPATFVASSGSAASNPRLVHIRWAS